MDEDKLNKLKSKFEKYEKLKLKKGSLLRNKNILQRKKFIEKVTMLS